MEFLTNTAVLGLAASVILLVLAKLLPNEKVYSFGYKLGLALTVFGSAKVGRGWGKLEDFFINSGGQFFGGLKQGLNSDDDDEPEVRT